MNRQNKKAIVGQKEGLLLQGYFLLEDNRHLSGRLLNSENQLIPDWLAWDSISGKVETLTKLNVSWWHGLSISNSILGLLSLFK